jgi:hypothetical protein
MEGQLPDSDDGASYSSPSSSSSSSSVSSSSSHAPSNRAVSIHTICKKLCKKVSMGLNDSISCADHRKVGMYLCELKNRMLEMTSEDVDADSKMALTCAGVQVLKRVVCGNESDTSIENLKRTMALLFVVVVISNMNLSKANTTSTGSGDDGDVEGDDEMEIDNECKTNEEISLDSWKNGKLEDFMEDCVGDTMSKEMKNEIRTSNVCRLCMKIAESRADVANMEEAIDLAQIFFHQSSHAMSFQLFSTCSKPGEDFLTLSSASFLASVSSVNNVRLQAIAEIAESEAGQSCLRDFILSFTLPRSVVGLRKTCLLTRKSNTRATKEFPAILGEAHDAAMRGASYSWTDDEKVIHKVCSILAGIAVVMTKTAQSIRRDDAFCGRVSLPFLETRIDSGSEFLPRMHYVADSDSWVVYKMSSKSGLPSVDFQGVGFEGCCQACLLFMNSVEA